MKSPAILAIAALIVAAPASAQIYKCEIDGRTVYNDQPCREGATQQILTVPQEPPSASAEDAPDISPVAAPPADADQAEAKAPSQPQQQVEEQYSDYELKHLAGKHQVVETMPAELVRRAWGDPDMVRRQMNSGGVTEIWEYHPGGFEHRYVYLQNGRVINVDIQR